jgi:hypothetical protein
VSLAGFRVFGFVGASGVVHSINKPLSLQVVPVQGGKVEDTSRAEGNLVWAERVKNIVAVTAMACVKGCLLPT